MSTVTSKVNGKNKGSSYERKIANLLSARFEKVTGIVSAFRRNADSGSYFGGSNQRRVVTHDLNHANFGDLICPDGFKYSVECKNYKTGPTFAAIVKSKVTQWDTWIKQATQDARNSKKEMLLIIKYNGTDDLVFVEQRQPTLKPLFYYNQVFGYRLKDFLARADDEFFPYGLEKYTAHSVLR